MAEWSEEQIRAIAKKEAGGGDGCFAWLALILLLTLALPYIYDLQRRVGQLEVQVQQLERRSK